MKKLCNCNAEWQQMDMQYFKFHSTQVVQLGGDDACLTCAMFFWYNPQYENMMYDLREMNKQ